MLADLLKMIIKTEKTIGMHDRASLAEVNHKSATMGRLLRVSGLLGVLFSTLIRCLAGHKAQIRAESGLHPTSIALTDVLLVAEWDEPLLSEGSGRFSDTKAFCV